MSFEGVKTGPIFDMQDCERAHGRPQQPVFLGRCDSDVGL